MTKQILVMLMMLLGIYLSRGCSSVNDSGIGSGGEVFEQCAPTFVYVDGNKIDEEKSFCSTRQFRFSSESIGPLKGSDSKKPISYCDRCVGFKKYTDVFHLWESVRMELKQQEVKREEQKAEGN